MSGGTPSPGRRPRVPPGIAAACISAGVVLACTLFMKAAGGVVVYGHSMDPTLHDGQVLFCRPPDGEASIKRGDIVVFKEGGMRLVKRAVGIPGDSVLLMGGALYINGAREARAAGVGAIAEGNAGNLADGAYVVGEHGFYCVGDNRNASRDSREFGEVAYADIEYVYRP